MTTSNLVVGAIAIGRSGVSGIVTQIESDRVTVELPDGVKKRVPIGSIVSWEPPPLVTGQQVKFIGDPVLFGELDEGEILEVVEDCGEWVKTRTNKRKPVSVMRSNLEPVGEETVDRETHQPSDQSQNRLIPPQPHRLSNFEIGDRVLYIGGIWTADLGDRTGTITDTNHLTHDLNRFEVDWGENWAGCRWFEESELSLYQ